MRSSFSLLILCLVSLSAPVSNLGWTQDRRILVAVLGFGASEIGRLASETFAQNLESEPGIQILDRDQATAAAKGAGHTVSLNMSLEEARGLGAALGSDYFIIGDSQTLRRSPSAGPIYFESYASIFLVSARSGKLLMWRRPSFKASTPSAAEKLLLDELSSHPSRSQTLTSIRHAQVNERAKREIAVLKGVPVIESAPDDDKTANADGLRLPRPFRRLTPAYPETAATAEVEAVVDVLVDLDRAGEVSNVEVSRWAGFGLDESTIDTVRQLHFFPAMRNGTPIPLRVLLRYNFRKPPK